MSTRSQAQKLGSSAEHYISISRLSSLQKGSFVKLLVLFVFALSCMSLVVAVPTDSEAISSRNNVDPQDLEKRQAGLAWGPVYIGNLKLSLTNPHDGYAGPKFPYANHVNFHVDKQALKTLTHKSSIYI